MFYAQIDKNNIIQQVAICEENDAENWFKINVGGTWVQTYEDGSIRKNFAGIGFSYDKTRDAFIPPKHFASWVLNEDTCQWEAPTPMPEDGKDYSWDEDSVSWVEIPTPVIE